MYLKIIKVIDKYEAIIKDGDNISSIKDIFKTAEALEKEYLNQTLLSLGFNQRDIYDAFDEADGDSINMKHPLN